MPATLTENRPLTWQELKKLAAQVKQWPQFKKLESHERRPILEAANTRKVSIEALQIIRRLTIQRINEFASITRHPLFKEMERIRPKFAQAIVDGSRGGQNFYAQTEAVDYWDSFLEVRRPKPVLTPKGHKKGMSLKHQADKAKSSGKKK